jgi:hypothetical protein
MESMSRATWTDERLDDFARSVDRRFDEVDRRFDDVDRRFDRVDEEFRELRSQISLIQRMMLLYGGGVVVTVAVGFVGVVVTQA